MKSFLKKQWFTVGMIIMILLGAFLPDAGSSLNPDRVTTTGFVIILFFLAGLSLPTETLKEGMKDIRLHIFLQAFIYIITPLYFFLTAFPFKGVMGGQLIIGIYALAVLPTTVSSCIVFTQLSEGNTIGAVFNASFANLAGIFISPLLLTFFLNSAGNPMPIEELIRIFQGLVVKMLIPFAIGQGLHIGFKAFAVKYKKVFGIMSNLLVLGIVFFSVAKSIENESLQLYWKQLIVPFIYLAVSNLVLLVLAYFGARVIGLNRANIITTLYVAPQKTLAMGVPLLSTYFVSQPEILGIALLPILFYHPWQLFIAGLIKDSKLIKKL
jgi:solute carrier family 10 (sodium/bile acid cotransporter), member 7